MRRITPRMAAIAAILVFVSVELRSADTTFEQRLSEELARGAVGFVSNPGLVDTNNWARFLTNSPLSFSKLQGMGELAGVKLGMTMSQVVNSWGKPEALFTRCGLPPIGPRFYYGNRVVLSFVGDRLVRFSFWEQEPVVFDNGLRLHMGKAQIEALFGGLRARSIHEYGNRPVFEMTFGSVRTRLAFDQIKDHLRSIFVELPEYTDKPGEQNAPPNAAEPHR